MAQSKTEWWLIVIGHTAQKTPEYSLKLILMVNDILMIISSISEIEAT